MKQKVFTDLEGVYANGIHAGIKQKKKDLESLISNKKKEE